MSAEAFRPQLGFCRPFSPTTDTGQWDAFVLGSANGTILQTRRFLSYHGDRFKDASVVIESPDAGIMLAVMPAAERGSTIISHPGATHGGLIVSPSLGVLEQQRIFQEMTVYLRRAGFEELKYTPVPPLFHRHRTVGDLHELWNLGAPVVARQITTTLDPGRSLGRKKNRRIAARAGVHVSETDDVSVAYEIIRALLEARHGTSPVHHLSELQDLRRRLPAEMRILEAQLRGKSVATAVTMELPGYTHFQYMASTDTGRKVQALDAIVEHVWESVSGSGTGLSFGSSTDKSGRVINEGLQRFKEGFGARSDFIDTYVLDLFASRNPPSEPT